LIESINRIGLLQPPKIKPRGRKAGTFELIDGERRLHAIKKLQWNIIPCIVEDVDDEKAWEQTLASNIVRTDLSPTERIEAYGYWVDLKLKQNCEEYKKPGKNEKEPLRKLANFLNKQNQSKIVDRIERDRL